MAGQRREALALLVAGLAACTVDPLTSSGRPCSATDPCGPDATCDLARGVCVAATLDRGFSRDLPGEGSPPGGDALGRDAVEADARRTDLHLSDTGCPPGLTLCGSTCVDLTTSQAHCSKCDTPCAAPTADRCVSGTCVCGTTGGPCGAASVCVSGACDANPCLGKSDGTVCDDTLYCTVGDACKSGSCAGTPRDCGSMASACNNGVCDEAADQCVAKPKVGGTPCGSGSSSGQCFAGSCCPGCWNGASCSSGNAAAACGDRGDLCQDCTSLECRGSPGTSCGAWFNNVCSTSSAKPDGTSCTGGKCLDGACCTGCRDGGHCRPGTYPGLCGAAGSSCVSCLSECRTGSTCTGGVCADPLKPDGAACTNGKCLAGACCTGCIESGTCQASTVAHCGTGGTTCKTCPPTTLTCKQATCTSGSCGVGNAPNGSSCTGGTCLSGTCCKGCVDGSTCRTGNEDAYCGAAGAACTDCAAQTLICSSGSCG